VINIASSLFFLAAKLQMDGSFIAISVTLKEEEEEEHEEGKDEEIIKLLIHHNIIEQSIKI
jgi:hypothetical protein